MKLDSLMLDAPVLTTEQASVILGLNGRACLDKKRFRGVGPTFHTIGDSELSQPRIRYSLRALIDYAIEQETM